MNLPSRLSYGETGGRDRRVSLGYTVQQQKPERLCLIKLKEGKRLPKVTPTVPKTINKRFYNLKPGLIRSGIPILPCFVPEPFAGFETESHLEDMAGPELAAKFF